MKRTLLCCTLALIPLAAQAQKVYKHVDEKGNVTYSQTAPAGDAKAISVPPPRKVPPPSRYRGDEVHAERQAERERLRLEHERRQEERREAMQEAQRKEQDALRAECARNRGTDCNDPATLARMKAERGPSQYRPRAR